MIKFKTIITFSVLIFLISITVLYPSKKTDNPITIHSKILKEDRTIFISAPIDYSKTNFKYPVLYILDADIHFDYIASIIRYLSSIAGKIPEFILVGISNKNRFNDMVFNPKEKNQFLKFIQKELLPYINRNFRANSFKLLFGHSLGAHFALNTLFRKPNLFNGYFVISPCFHLDPTLLNVIKKRQKITKGNRTFLYIAKETFLSDQDRKTYHLFKTIFDHLPGQLIRKRVRFKKENHESIGPIALIKGLEFIFEDFSIKKEHFVNNGIEGIKTHLKKLNKRYNFKIIPLKKIINGIGLYFLSKQDYDSGIEAFKLNLQNHPNSPDILKFLAEAYLNIGDKKLAISYYNKILTLEPNNEKARNKLHKLKSKKKSSIQD